MRMRIWNIVLVGGLILPAAAAQEAGPRLGRFARGLAGLPAKQALKTWNRPFEPLRIIGNIFYVGPEGVSSFLITTREGHILLDTGFDETAPMIVDHVRKLGFRVEDIKLILNSHAHFDHVGSHASLKKLTGARIVMSEQDAGTLSRGGRGDFLPLGDETATYPPAEADRIIGDGDRVTLGGVTLTAHLTPGHTRGCTTWTMSVEDLGKRYDVVFDGSTTILPGVLLVGNPKYPGIAEDYARTFRTLKSLPCDVFLAPHASMFGLQDKARRLAAGESPNPFIDPRGYRSFIERSERTYLDQLRGERERASHGRTPEKDARKSR